MEEGDKLSAVIAENTPLIEENTPLIEENTTLMLELTGWMHHAEVLVKQFERQSVETSDTTKQFYLKLDIAMLNTRLEQTKQTIAKLKKPLI